VAARVFRFRRFGYRVLALLLALLCAALGTTFWLVSAANAANARAHARANLELGARYYAAAIDQRIEFLVGSASVMSGDDAIKQTLREESLDARTLASLLVSYTQRVGAPVIGLFDPEGRQLANSEPGMDNENAGPFAHLIARATQADMPQASDYSYLKNELHVLVAVPLYAPYPVIIDWFGLAFPIDRAFAQKIKDITRIEVTFVATENPAAPRVLATTLSDVAAQIVARAAVARRPAEEPVATLTLPDDDYVSLFQKQDLLGEAPIAVVLQRPLGPELAAAHELESAVLRISVVALCLATLLALWIARGVSQPVQQLAAHTQRIARGDYDARIALDRVDELGQLADAMNAMSAGLAERDRVRDLLDKNVSPEVAAQLLRDGAALGGEEREVTILFADLRGFTTLSEKLTPGDLLGLLNRYLDRMSAAIEEHGGVIDKFIGDAIMALFGAPVAQGDAADRALAAALAMERALAELNTELSAEGKTPLALGIGVNTARVVAGNIGSHRRLNYSVIGDGVNVAARLQSLTRTPEYHTNIITGAATIAACRRSPSSGAPSSVLGPPSSVLRPPSFRPLGRVQVKGRAEPVEIFAVW
jgi:adenylate cyclase